MSEPVLRCSFCNKEQKAVRKLIAGPNVCICDECVAVCVEIINDDSRFSGDKRVEPPRRTLETEWVSTVYCALCRMPMLAEEALPIRERGPLCGGCVGEIEAAIAARGQGDSEH